MYIITDILIGIGYLIKAFTPVTDWLFNNLCRTGFIQHHIFQLFDKSLRTGKSDMFHPIHFWRTVIISEQSSGLVLYLLVDVILDDQAFTLVLGGFYLEAFQVDFPVQNVINVVLISREITTAVRYFT